MGVFLGCCMYAACVRSVGRLGRLDVPSMAGDTHAHFGLLQHLDGGVGRGRSASIVCACDPRFGGRQVPPPTRVKLMYTYLPLGVVSATKVQMHHTREGAFQLRQTTHGATQAALHCMAGSC